MYLTCTCTFLLYIYIYIYIYIIDIDRYRYRYMMKSSNPKIGLCGTPQFITLASEKTWFNSLNDWFP